MIWPTESYPMASPVIDMHGIPSRPRVLVAEDQEDVIAALHLLLKSAGYEAEFVRSPEGALTALATKSFAAILLDLNYSRDTTSGTESLELLSNVQPMDSTHAGRDSGGRRIDHCCVIKVGAQRWRRLLRRDPAGRTALSHLHCRRGGQRHERGAVDVKPSSRGTHAGAGNQRAQDLLQS